MQNSQSIGLSQIVPKIISDLSTDSETLDEQIISLSQESSSPLQRKTKHLKSDFFSESIHLNRLETQLLSCQERINKDIHNFSLRYEICQIYLKLAAFYRSNSDSTAEKTRLNQFQEECEVLYRINPFYFGLYSLKALFLEYQGIDCEDIEQIEKIIHFLKIASALSPRQTNIQQKLQGAIAFFRKRWSKLEEKRTIDTATFILWNHQLNEWLAKDHLPYLFMEDPSLFNLANDLHNPTFIEFFKKHPEFKSPESLSQKYPHFNQLFESNALVLIDEKKAIYLPSKYNQNLFSIRIREIQEAKIDFENCLEQLQKDSSNILIRCQLSFLSIVITNLYKEILKREENPTQIEEQEQAFILRFIEIRKKFDFSSDSNPLHPDSYYLKALVMEYEGIYYKDLELIETYIHLMKVAIALAPTRVQIQEKLDKVVFFLHNKWQSLLEKDRDNQKKYREWKRKLDEWIEETHLAILFLENKKMFELANLPEHAEFFDQHPEFLNIDALLRKYPEIRFKRLQKAVADPKQTLMNLKQILIEALNTLSQASIESRILYDREQKLKTASKTMTQTILKPRFETYVLKKDPEKKYIKIYASITVKGALNGSKKTLTFTWLIPTLATTIEKAFIAANNHLEKAIAHAYSSTGQEPPSQKDRSPSKMVSVKTPRDESQIEAKVNAFMKAREERLKLAQANQTKALSSGPKVESSPRINLSLSEQITSQSDKTPNEHQTTPAITDTKPTTKSKKHKHEFYVTIDEESPLQEIKHTERDELKEKTCLNICANGWFRFCCPDDANWSDIRPISYVMEPLRPIGNNMPYGYYATGTYTESQEETINKYKIVIKSIHTLGLGLLGFYFISGGIWGEETERGKVTYLTVGACSLLIAISFCARYALRQN